MIGGLIKGIAVVPGWAWAGLGGAIAIGLGVWWHQDHSAAVVADAVRTAVAAERKTWVDAQAIAQIKHNTEVEVKELQAWVNLTEFQRASQQRAEQLAARNAQLAARNVSLQQSLSSYRDAIDRAERESPGAAGIAHAAREAGEVFGRCSAAHLGLAAEAGRLAAKVTDLQLYITRVVAPVCIAPPGAAEQSQQP